MGGGDRLSSCVLCIYCYIYPKKMGLGVFSLIFSFYPLLRSTFAHTDLPTT